MLEGVWVHPKYGYFTLKLPKTIFSFLAMPSQYMSAAVLVATSLHYLTVVLWGCLLCANFAVVFGLLVKVKSFSSVNFQSSS